MIDLKWHENSFSYAKMFGQPTHILYSNGIVVGRVMLLYAGKYGDNDRQLFYQPLVGNKNLFPLLKFKKPESAKAYLYLVSMLWIKHYQKRQ